MRKKISISVEENTLIKLDDYVVDGTFRSKSHVIEVALNKFIKEKENE